MPRHRPARFSRYAPACQPSRWCASVSRWTCDCVGALEVVRRGLLDRRDRRCAAVDVGDAAVRDRARTCRRRCAAWRRRRRRARSTRAGPRAPVPREIAVDGRRGGAEHRRTDLLLDPRRRPSRSAARRRAAAACPPTIASAVGLIGDRAEHRDLRVRCDVAAGRDRAEDAHRARAARSDRPPAAGAAARRCGGCRSTLAKVSPNSELFSTKNGRRSGRRTSYAVRLTNAGSASTWPKSGLIVAGDGEPGKRAKLDDRARR